MADVTVTFTAVNIPTNTSVALTVYEDVGNDGTGASSFTDANGTSHNYDNSNSTTLSNGVTSYTLTGFNGGAGDGYYVDLQPDNTDDVSTASLTEQVSVTAAQTIGASAATLSTAEPSVSVTTTGGRTISASVGSLTATEVSPTVSATFTIGASVGTLTATDPAIDIDWDLFINPTVSTLTLTEPSITIGVTIGATVESLTLAEPGPDVRLAAAQTIAASIDVLSAVEPTVQLFLEQWTIGNTQPAEITDFRLTYDRLRLDWVVSLTEIDDVRRFADDAGEYDKLVDSDGAWRALDDSLDDGNTYSVKPPGELLPPLDGAVFVVDNYDESSRPAGHIKEVTAEFVRTEPYDKVGVIVTESAGPDQWEFAFSDGAIATQHVTRADTGAQEDIGMHLELDADQAAVVKESARTLDAVTVEEIPDGDDFVRDNSPGSENTVDITRPSNLSSDWFETNGEYVVRDWSLTQRGLGVYEVTLTVRKV